MRGSMPYKLMLLAVVFSARAVLAQESSVGAVIINYHRDDEDYNNPSLWTWDGREQKNPPKQEISAAGRTDFGVRFTLTRSLYGNDDSDAERIGFIPRLNSDWNRKDGGDRFWTPALGNEVWIVANDPKIYTQKPDVSARVIGAYLDTANEIRVKLSTSINASEIPAAKFVLTKPDGTIAETKIASSPTGRTNSLSITTTDPINPSAGKWTLSSARFTPVTVTPRAILFNPALYGTDMQLGAVYTKDSTTFRAFSPLADSLSVLLFDAATGESGKRELPMKPVGKGVWEAAQQGDLNGKFYRLKVHTPQLGDQVIIDPYATNTTGNDGNARITDLRAQDPDGFRPVKHPFTGTQASAIIYQLHVRDFTINESSGVPIADRGKFAGFVDEGTTLPSHPDIKTAIDHLKELGVTHVQLQPLQDFDNNESNPEYSWGYMTAFFNSPDGTFASNIRTEARIKEFKAMVKALKDANIGVIMDVVYNHTGTQNSFEQLAPGYYHRMRDDGSFWNGSGTGNEFKSESPMGRKFIVDSCRFWAEEYGIDGFRFDLMGLIDKDTMIELRRELTKINPSILLYGEPWAAVGPDGTGLGTILYKDKVRGSGLAAFNDHFRDAIKGSTEGNDGGYIQNGSRRDAVVKGIEGSINDWASSPQEVVNYFSVHDNLDLWDKLAISTNGASEQDRIRMVELAGAILATSQGSMLLHGGTDFCRYKHGNHNSYNAGDKINAIDWQRKLTYRAVNVYFQGLIALRRAHPVFALGSAEEIRQRLKFEAAPTPNAIAFSISGEGLEGEQWRKVCVLINPDAAPANFSLPSGGSWRIYAQANKAGLSPLGEITGASLTVDGRAAVIIAQ
ncbi:type I pullulanase [Candidatus Sumerlaeota bacterium]|nr:type I pullulanase [Candidatus Sumerlaeota bacterium]